MKIRNAHKNDYASICHLVKTKEELFLISPASHFPLTVEKLEQIALTRLALTVAESEKQIIGFVNLYDFTAGNEVFIGNLIISNQHRKKGLGRKLVQHMLAIAFTELKLANVCLSVFNENTVALNLYHSLGFRPYAFEQRITPDGNKVILIHTRLKQTEWQNDTGVNPPSSDTKL